MRLLYALLVWAIVVALLVSAAPVGAERPGETAAQTRSIVKRFVTGYNRHDLAAVLALAAPHIRYTDCNYTNGQTEFIWSKRAFARWLRHQFAQNDHLRRTTVHAPGWTIYGRDPHVFGVTGSRTSAAITARGLASESIDGSKGRVNKAGTKIQFFLLATCAALHGS